MDLQQSTPQKTETQTLNGNNQSASQIQQDSWLQNLKNISDLISLNDHQSFRHLKKIIHVILNKFTNIQLKHHQKLQFTCLLQKLITENLRNDNKQTLFQTNGYIGQRLHSLQKRAQKQHKNIQVLLNFLNQFHQLTFNLSYQQITQFLNILKPICQINKNYFFFFCLYAELSIKNQLKTGHKLDKVKQQFGILLQKICKSYQKNKLKKDQNNEKGEYFNFNLVQIQKEEQNTEIFSFEKTQKSHYQQFQDFIHSRAKQAQKDQQKCIELIKQVFYDKGYNIQSYSLFDTQHKDSQSSIKFIKILFQQIIQLNYQQNKFRKIQSQFYKNNLELVSQTLKTQSVEEVNKLQDPYIFNYLEQSFQSKQSIKYLTSTLTTYYEVRVLFSSVQDILEAVQNLKRISYMNEYKILSLTNNLLLKQKNVKIQIKLPSSIVKIQMILDLGTYDAEFGQLLNYNVKNNLNNNPYLFFQLFQQFQLFTGQKQENYQSVVQKFKDFLIANNQVSSFNGFKSVNDKKNILSNEINNKLQNIKNLLNNSNGENKIKTTIWKY